MNLPRDYILKIKNIYFVYWSNLLSVMQLQQMYNSSRLSSLIEDCLRQYNKYGTIQGAALLFVPTYFFMQP